MNETSVCFLALGGTVFAEVEVLPLYAGERLTCGVLTVLGKARRTRHGRQPFSQRGRATPFPLTFRPHC
jgi:hypothetical protein